MAHFTYLCSQTEPKESNKTIETEVVNILGHVLQTRLMVCMLLYLGRVIKPKLFPVFKENWSSNLSIP